MPRRNVLLEETLKKAMGETSSPSNQPLRRSPRLHLLPINVNSARQTNAKKNPETSSTQPLRRSPRLHLQPIDGNITKQTNSKKNQVCPSSIYNTRLRSSKMTSHMEANDLTKTNCQDYTQQRQKKPSRSRKNRVKPATSFNGIDISSQSLRRSPRFSHSVRDSSQVIGLDMTQKEESTRTGTRSVQLTSSAKNSGKSDLKCRGFDDFGRSKQREHKGTSSVTLTAREGGESKRRLRERRGKEEIFFRVPGNAAMESNTLEEPNLRKTDSQVSLILMGGRENERTEVEATDHKEVCKEIRDVENGCASLEWTRAQEVALHRAYLAAKPSPHFWKKVSKMVPGKSAQECFDRVHCSLVTPSQPEPRSRRNPTKSSPVGRFSLSASKLGVVKPTGKRSKGGKKKGLLAQKTVRQMLRKHSTLDEEVDLFSVLETSTKGFSQIEMTSTFVSHSPGLPCSCVENPSTYKNMLSKVKTTDEANNASPEVLKRIKNMTLHEKYIDKLHCREAKRRMCCKAANGVTEGDDKENGVPKRGFVKAAKNALILEARDFIGQFQLTQSTFISNDADFSDSSADGDHELVDSRTKYGQTFREPMTSK